ncbi:hypothetical protein TrispH2_006713 [Trichoplax sp. H2]|nr:hypothetical protein TrispH2_006713 [Trichoplax sp. H2]|eukprot:RDD40917.1 hypothetical protein TrispH2_006713 [Trichoplax sp. H2]
MAFPGDGGVSLDSEDIYGEESSRGAFVNLGEESSFMESNTNTVVRERAIHNDFQNNFGDIFDDDDID